MRETPWGQVIDLPNATKNPSFDFRLLIIKPKQATSLQKHQFHDKEWFLCSGSLRVLFGESLTALQISNVSPSTPFVALRDKWCALVNTSDEFPVFVYEKRIANFTMTSAQRDEDKERALDFYQRAAPYPSPVQAMMFSRL